MQLEFDELEESFRTKRPLLPPLRFIFDWEFKILTEFANLNHILLRQRGRMKALQDEQYRISEARKFVTAGTGLYRELSEKLAEIDDEINRLKRDVDVTHCEVVSIYLTD